ncbi:MAG TPA: 1,4-alpha-glucan branching protein domain-containing protein [Chthoniobacterales bacterium]
MSLLHPSDLALSHSGMQKGYLALVLHAHLPFVHHPEYPEFLEEDWLYEAITETYVPIWQVLEGLVRDGVPFQLTMSLTPTLCAMLDDELLRDRYLRYLDRAIRLSRSEIDRTQHQPEYNHLARLYHSRFLEIREIYVERLQRDLVQAFRRFQDLGVLEIIACAATHGFLPLMEQTPEAVRAQVLIGRDRYVRSFGRPPRGIWLPECAYFQGLEKVLAEAEIRWFILDAHGLMFGHPRPRYAIYAPCFTPAGPAVFSRDRESAKQVWSAREGYPGDPAYRDFYRDIGFDLDLDYLRPFLPPDGQRKNTGIKYHRITGRTTQKEVYVPGWAQGAADWHAGDFMNSRAKQLQHLVDVTQIEPIVVSPFDAELFGHWWYEGPQFLNLFIRKAVYDQQEFRLITPSGYLERHDTLQVVTPSPSSWGHKGFWEVWLDEANAWIYPHLHAAARRMIESARAAEAKPAKWKARMLQQMGRELLLAQASDWAFLMKTGTARDYAAKRTRDHLLRFTRLYDHLKGGTMDEAFLNNCEYRDNLFPDLDWKYYA